MATRWWLTALIALVAIVAGIVVWSFVQDDVEVVSGDTTTTDATDTTVPAEETTTTTSAETTTTTGETTTTGGGETTTTALAPIGMASAEDAVLAWIDALAAGDLDTAWALLDVAAQDAVGGRAAFEDLRTDLAEGFGAWADAVDRVAYVAVVEETFQSEVEVVTLVGEVTQEGDTVESLAAVPAIIRSDVGFQVLAFVRGDLVEFVRPVPIDPADPDAATPLPATGPIEVVVPETATLVVISVDDELVLAVDDTDLTPADDGRALASFSIDPPLEAGRHALTVVYLDEDVVHADAVLFDAVG